MATFEVKDEDLTPLKDSVLVITGGASGIGLATAELFLSLGAHVFIGDMNSPPDSSPTSSAARFLRTDVTVWRDLLNLFKTVKSEYGHIDFVFANAGIGPRETYIEDSLDSNGDLVEPASNVLDVNLKGCINTVRLAIHHMRPQQHGGGIVATASASGYQRFSAGDYTIAKHGVLGLVRALYHPLSGTSIRLNAIAPSWTESGLVVGTVAEKAGLHKVLQPPSAVARSVALLMVDKKRHGGLVYSEVGKYVDIEQALLDAADTAMAKVGHTESDEELRARLIKAAIELGHV